MPRYSTGAIYITPRVRGMHQGGVYVPPAPSFLLLEDGVSFLLLEDGVSKLQLEANN